jgi:hypothetical protein
MAFGWFHVGSVVAGAPPSDPGPQIGFDGIGPTQPPWIGISVAGAVRRKASHQATSHPMPVHPSRTLMDRRNWGEAAE